MKKVILITGSSSGMGLEAALLLAKKHTVYATLHSLDSEKEVQARAKKEGVALKCLELDVTKPASVGKAIDTIIGKEGRVDVLINNAGFGVVSPFEMVSEADFTRQFDVNFYGYVRCIQEVLPHMRKQKAGTIINVSSVAGVAGFGFWSAYVSTKFAVEGLTECLKAEVQPFGIDVKMIEPGPVATKFDKDMIKGNRKVENNPYLKSLDKTFQAFKEMLQQGQAAKDAAKTYVEAV
ncbi:MAG: SDR family oxidoreductase, partial [archaeon]